VRRGLRELSPAPHEKAEVRLMNNVWQQAKEIAETLPRNAQWSFCVTDIEEDAVFNIYAPLEAWHGLRLLLAITRRPAFSYRNYDGRFPSFDEYNMDGLVLSFITTEEHNDDEPAGPAGSDINADNARHGCGIPWIE